MLFEGESDDEGNFKTNNEYAKNYDVWRKKEELNKLKTKYGDDLELEEDSSSSSDDENGVELNEKVEKDFFKTLACLKNKDPCIYDKNVRFFESSSETPVKRDKKDKDRPMFLKDYERNIILEKKGILSDEEDNGERPKSPTYVEEQKNIKEKLKAALDAVDEDEDGFWGGVFKERKKSKKEKEQEEADYKKWLTGQRKDLDDKEVEIELKPLKDYWTKPDLDDGEKFLRDYILNKKFLDNDNDDYIPTYDEIVHDSDQSLSNDEDMIEKQEEFEQKYNFRFEEPDPEFIKRFPRTMENSLRKTDDRRKIKREEVKERKKKEKEEKMQDLKKLQELKRKEIEEKLEKLKEITGNPSIGFEDDDLDGEFDPEKHDKKMQALFNDEFYQGQEEEQKPEFPDLDEELDIENWERFDVNANNDNDASAPHCEDDDFNMDCDYDPQKSTQKDLIENTKRKKRKRKSKFAEALSKPKPKFDPADKNYEKYFDEYYKLDCEDIIADIPCRFKYREVIPNDFGLTVEEILLAKERELNKWCSLKKAVQIRPEHVEKYEQIAYKKKGQNLNLKKKILPSLFTPETKEETLEDDKGKSSEGQDKVVDTIEGEKNNKNVKNNETDKKNDEHLQVNFASTYENGSSIVSKRDVIKKNEKNKHNASKNKNEQRKHEHLQTSVATTEDTEQFIGNKQDSNENGVTKKNKKKKRKISISNNESMNKPQVSINEDSNGKKRKRSHVNSQRKGEIEVSRKKIKKGKNQQESVSTLTDARLLAYGIKPKKFKNKLKYKK